jgi:hypothetical protein
MTDHAVDYRSAAPKAVGSVEPPLINQRDFGQMIEPLQDVIIRYPGAALASAFLVGVVVAWWIKRR